MWLDFISLDIKNELLDIILSQASFHDEFLLMVVSTEADNLWKWLVLNSEVFLESLYELFSSSVGWAEGDLSSAEHFIDNFLVNFFSISVVLGDQKDDWKLGLKGGSDSLSVEWNWVWKLVLVDESLKSCQVKAGVGEDLRCAREISEEGNLIVVIVGFSVKEADIIIDDRS